MYATLCKSVASELQNMITLNASLDKVTFHAADTAVRNCAGFLMHSLSIEISVEVTASSRLPCLGAVLSMGCITSVFNNTYLSCKKIYRGETSSAIRSQQTMGCVMTTGMQDHDAWEIHNMKRN